MPDNLPKRIPNRPSSSEPSSPAQDPWHANGVTTPLPHQPQPPPPPVPVHQYPPQPYQQQAQQPAAPDQPQQPLYIVAPNATAYAYAAPRVVIRTGPNHALHFLLTLLTCGAWVFVWIAVTIISALRRPR